MAHKLERSTGNVFRDIGFEAADAESLRIRATLMVELRQYMESRKLTQQAAAKLWGVTQPRVSDLVRGKIELFSIDTLVDMLSQAGVKLQLSVRTPRVKAPRRKAA